MKVYGFKSIKPNPRTYENYWFVANTKKEATVYAKLWLDKWSARVSLRRAISLDFKKPVIYKIKDGYLPAIYFYET